QLNVAPPNQGKWTDILLPVATRGLYREVTAKHFTALSSYGSTSLGTVTGNNSFFALTESTRVEYELTEQQLDKISPPGSRHLRAASFTARQWRDLRDAGERVWLFRPDADDESASRKAYTTLGVTQGVDKAYKCQIRSPWWRPPLAKTPDLFFTYM